MLGGREVELRRIAAVRYWREPEASVVVTAWRRSGDSQAAFSGRLGIELGRLRRWARRLAAEKAIRFVPVRLSGARSPVAEAEVPLELRIGQGRSIVIREGFSEAALLRLLAVLDQTQPPC